jgi:hypothetical protein
MDLRVGVVSTVAPRLTVLTPARSDITLSGVTLLIRYIGQPVDSAQYAPISTTGNTTLLFQFDSLLFDQPFGFYEGTLQFNGMPYAQFQFRYTSDTSISAALQLSTTETYVLPVPYAAPDWSGTGIGGPGTFVGLKDCPKQYGGAAGFTVVVNSMETGLEFRPGQPMPAQLVINLPTPGAQVRGLSILATNARKAGEGAGTGTGCPVWCDGTSWRTYYDNSVAAA